MFAQEANEYFDIMTPDNVPTGAIKSRADTHRDGDWHRAIHIWIVNSSGEVLLQKRSKNKLQHPGTWDIAVGGHIEAGAQPIDAALREAAEELGLTIQANELHYLCDLNCEDNIKGWPNPHREVITVYLLRRDIPLDQLQLQREEVEAAAWIPIMEFEQDLSLNPLKYCPHPEEYERIIPFLKAASS